MLINVPIISRELEIRTEFTFNAESVDGIEQNPLVENECTLTVFGVDYKVLKSKSVLNNILKERHLIVDMCE